jgi:Uma2 family endonuclease
MMIEERNDPMSTITQEMPPAPATPGWVPSRLYRMTVEQYEAMAASGAIPMSHRVHLINGYLVEKMTQKPPRVVADDLCGRELARVLPRWYIRPAKPVRLPGQHSEPEPDRCVVRGSIADYLDQHPGPGDIALVVEVADSSLADDRKLATEVYGPAGIPVCWIVDVNARRVEVYTRRVPQGYGPPEFFEEGQSVPVVIRGRVVGRIAVKNILPPRRRRGKAGGNGA